MSSTNTKTPLQGVVGVICDCLVDLTPDDQLRALEAARVTLGLRATTQSTTGRTPPRPVLPVVRVEMVNDRPLVVDQPQDLTQPQPDRGLVIALPGTTPPRRVREGRDASARQPARQLPGPAARSTPARGYVRSLRG